MKNLTGALAAIAVSVSGVVAIGVITLSIIVDVIESNS